MLRTLAKWVALAALGWGCSAYALGLGEIEIQSRLNQRLSAVVPISSATPRELESLNIELASNEDFERAGMERAEFLSSLKFEIKDNIIRVTSKDLAREPFVSFLLDVRWSGGRLLREYTVLLDPPTLAQPAKPAPSKIEEPVPRTAEWSASPALSQAEEELLAPAMIEEPPAVAQPEADVPEVASSPAYDGETYGPVQPKETLWSIAYKLRPDSELTMDQMQVAIFNANPQAFRDGRLTGLMKGSVIRIPSVEEIQAVDPVSAKAQVRKANRSSGNPASVTPPPTPQAAAEQPDAVTETPTPVPAETIAPPPSETVAQTPSAEPAAAAPADQATAQSPPTQTAEPSPTAAQTPVDPSQMVDEPAPEQPVTTETAPAEAVQTEPLPPPTAAPVQEVEEPGLLDQALGLIDHPLFLPIAAGLAALLILLVLGGKLRDKFARWSYERASRKKIVPTAQLKSAPSVQAPEAELEPADDLAGATSIARGQPAPAKEPEPMPARDIQRAVAQTQQHTMQQTLQQTQTQTQAQIQTQVQAQTQTQAQEATAAHTGAPKVDFDVSGTYATDTVQINLDAGDPVSEAEFHRAYGLYDEAALLLKQALQKDPKRTDVRVKLAEIYFETNKAAEFVEIAKQLKGQLPDAEWQKIALLGSQVAAGNDLFKDATAGASVDLSFDEPAPMSTPAPAAVPAAAAAGGNDMLDFTMDDINKMPDVTPPAAKAPSAAPAAGGGLEFDMSSLSLEPEKPVASKPAPAAGGDEFKMEDLNLGDFDLKLDTAAAPGTPPAPAAAAPETPELGGELSLEEAPAAGDESSTKLDLARAYMDMGDNDMARSLLNEVQKQGSAQQKKEAQELLSRVAS